ncbi:hypothetical protein [Labilibaculum sp.]|uniref:hypothetical protein n=1 Tax=Labilibaculum sp. TaxID=2060723 RepID=UPI002AA7FF03|nr:hypothetical protein [Labilibaculum sp.]
MKIKNLFLITILALSCASCASSVFYQVYNVESINKSDADDKGLLFEDENCSIRYNLWGEYGDMGYEFYNKTDQNIYLDLSESFFIVNGVAHDYFQNRIFSNSASQGVSVKNTATTVTSVASIFQTTPVIVASSGTSGATSGYSVSRREEKIICIPAKTSKFLGEFKINHTLLRDCDLLKYPKRKEVMPKSFDISDSPLVFSNRFLYMVGDSNEKVKLENKFYVEEITNYPEDEMFEMRYEEYCDERSFSKVLFHKFVSPKTFYIKYTKGVDTWEH